MKILKNIFYLTLFVQIALMLIAIIINYPNINNININYGLSGDFSLGGSMFGESLTISFLKFVFPSGELQFTTFLIFFGTIFGVIIIIGFFAQNGAVIKFLIQIIGYISLFTILSAYASVFIGYLGIVGDIIMLFFTISWIFYIIDIMGSSKESE